MSTPTNIPETPMGETEQDSFSKSKQKFRQQLQDIFQTILRLTGPDHFDQLCQWMEYKQYYTIDDFYESSYNDLENFDNKGSATEYKWKGKTNHLSPIVAQKLKCFIKWMTHEDRPYELHDDFLATLTRDSYLKPQSIPYSRMTSTMIHFKDHSWQTSRHKASMMLLNLIMTLRVVTSMKRNFSKESSHLYILFWLLPFKQKRGENESKNLKEMPGPSFRNYIITIQNQMLHNMTS